VVAFFVEDYMLLLFVFDLSLGGVDASVQTDVKDGLMVSVYGHLLSVLTCNVLRLLHDAHAPPPPPPLPPPTLSTEPSGGRRGARWAAAAVGAGALLSGSLLVAALHADNVSFEYSGLLARFMVGGTREAAATIRVTYSLLDVPRLLWEQIARPSVRYQSVLWFGINCVAAPALATLGCLLLAGLSWAHAPSRQLAAAHRFVRLLMPWAFLDVYAAALLILVPESHPSNHPCPSPHCVASMHHAARCRSPRCIT
jgi:hypothetical protein